MNGQPSAPFTMVYQNIQSLNSRLHAWRAVVSDLDVALPSTPLLYAYVESGFHEPKPHVPGWSCKHYPGPGLNKGGGISLLYHSSCPIDHLHSVTFQQQAHANAAATTAMVWHRVRPTGRSTFLLATVYLPPQNSLVKYYTDTILDSLDTVPQQYSRLPVLVVGDFNMRHEDWHQPPHNPSAPGAAASAMADWIELSNYTIHNRPGLYTHVVLSQDGVTPPAHSIIDLVLSSTPDLVHSISQPLPVASLRSDHYTLAIDMRLQSSAPPPRPPPTRPRLAWNHLHEPDLWQELLPFSLSQALLPLQPQLDALASGVIPPTSTPQLLLDSVYAEFEQAFAETCLAVVGTRLVKPNSKTWFNRPGVKDALKRLHDATAASCADLTSTALHNALLQAQRDFRATSSTAEQQVHADLCSAITERSNKARWALFKRTAPSSHTPLAGIVHPVTGALPVDHESSLNNLCSAFVAAAQPPLAHDPVAYSALTQRVAGWAGLLHPPPPHLQPIPAHCSDNWEFTLETVRKQCTLQNTQSAPGPDAILPIFLRYAGEDCWQALATLFTFSWRFSVTPLAWREANVMALWKQAGSKSSPASYRPISMTSIIARTFEHLVHHLLVEQLDPSPAPPQPQPNPQHQPVLPARPAAAAPPPRPPFFTESQFGFRKRRSTQDAIHYLVSNVQHVTRFRGADKQFPLCPVLFLDIKKAFDRVDHAILLDRLHDAGIHGRAWLWIRSFLTDRRMRTVDGSLCSDWQHIGYGVPQGCVLSPLLFLVFINTVAQIISADPASNLVRPVLFADDAALVPAPLIEPHGKSKVADINSTYLSHLKAAIVHLDNWSKASRMQFGSDKTKLVLFHAQQKSTDIDPSDYQQLQVCGFTIGLADSYTYLGVELAAHHLSWARHSKQALQAARLASNRVMRVALRSLEPSFAAIRTLVLSYVIPSCMYGAMFWARNLSESAERQLQAKFAGPLRAALHLPTTTHQLGMLVMCGVPSVKELAVKDELRYLHRFQQLKASSPDNPTVAIADKYTSFLHKHSPRDNIHPQYKLYSISHGDFITMPELFDPGQAGVVQHLSAADRSKLPPLPDPARLLLAARMWRTSGPARHRNFPPALLGTATLKDLTTFTRPAAAQLTPLIISRLGRWTTFKQWQAQHAPPPPAAGQLPPPDPHKHASSSPLTRCQTAAGTALFLRHGDLSYPSVVRRSRILTRRAYTQETRRDFQQANALPIDPSCTLPACAAAAAAANAGAPAPTETPRHILLDCPRYDSARQLLRSAMTAMGVGLSESSILLASSPPNLDRAQQSSLFTLTDTFLDAVDAIRKAAIGLLPLDAR